MDNSLPYLPESYIIKETKHGLACSGPYPIVASRHCAKTVKLARSSTIMNKEILGKFFKGAFTGGASSVTALLVAASCSINDEKAFYTSIGLAFLSGTFHAIWNKYFPPKANQ